MRLFPPVLLLVLSACGGGGSEPSADDLEAVKGEVHAFAPWEEAHGKIVSKLGEPAAVDGDAHTWRAAGDDGSCRILKVQRVGESVGSVNLTDGPCE